MGDKFRKNPFTCKGALVFVTNFGILGGSMLKWRNWQTRWTQNPVRLTPGVGSSPTFSTILALLLLSSASGARGGSDLIFQDNFLSYQNGSDGSPVWHPAKGSWHVSGGTYIQESSDYDCASLLRFMDRSFEFEAVFQQLGGEAGAGFIFSSRDSDATRFSQLARFDGNRIFIAGYFQDGEYNGISSVWADSFDLRKEHRLTLRVNLDTDTLSVTIDGTKILESPVRFRAGWVGLQSSGGRVRFREVRLSVLPMRRKSPRLSWPGKFAVSRSGEFVIPNERTGVLEIFDREGNFRRVIGSPASRKGQLHAPTGAAFLDDSTLIVCDPAGGRIHLFTYGGQWKSSAGPEVFPSRPVAVASDQRKILVLDTNRVRIFDDAMRLVAKFGAGHMKNPVDIAVSGGMVCVLNAGLSQIQCYSWDGRSAVFRKNISFGGGRARGIAVVGDSIFISLVNEIRAYTIEGSVKSFRGRSIGFILPQGIAAGRSGDLFVADYFFGRILHLPASIDDPSPTVTFPDTATAVIRYRDPAPPGGGASEGMSRTIGGLRAAHTYAFKTAKLVETIPPDAYSTPRYSFTTPPPRGQKMFARVRMAGLIFANVHDTAGVRGAVQPPLPESEIERIKAQLREAVKFYWIHSGMRLFLDLSIIVVRDSLSRTELYGQESWYPPKEDILRKYLLKNSMDIRSFSGILFLTCSQQMDATGALVLAGKGGAFTNGVGTGKGFGISWWDVTRAGHNAGNNWLMVHEFNHQLDDIFMVSGYPEYWFNHISPTIGTAAKFGEHFDANAYILRLVPESEWYDLKYTTLGMTRDSDGDGIPDNDPDLPLDEVRLGSDSTNADTDGDGVSDLDEVLSANWVREGWGEIYAGLFPNLRRRDSDGDGIDDLHDPYPCYPFTPEIRHGELKKFAESPDRKVSLSAGWTAEELRFKFRSDRKFSVKLMIDAGNDGWFMGRGNILITIGPGRVAPTVQVLNAADPDRWPFSDPSLAERVHVESSLGAGGESIELSLRGDDALELDYHDGKRIGLSAGFVDETNPAEKRYSDFFEPNRLVSVTLRK